VPASAEVQLARAMRIMHVALVAGLVTAASVFFFLRQGNASRFSMGSSFGFSLAAIALALVTIAVAFLAPRIPPRSDQEAPDVYWQRKEISGAAVILWTLIEGAGLLAWIGYLLTGIWAPAGVGVLAIAALALVRPGRFEGA
jgi:hypothetical protein